MLKEGAHLDAKGGYFRVDTFLIDDIPEFAYSRKVQGAGIKAVFTSILIAFLTTTFSSCFVVCFMMGRPFGFAQGRGESVHLCPKWVLRRSHDFKIARAFQISKVILSWFHRRGCLCHHRNSPSKPQGDGET